MLNKRIAFISLLALASIVHVSHAQNRTRFAGRFNAIDFAYGIPSFAPNALQVATGTTATGAGTLSIVTPGVTLSDGITIYPLATNAKITVGSGSTQETVTPTALSNCNYAAPYGSCQVTATFTYTHGTGENITSGSLGLQEAINAAVAVGGGAVSVAGTWFAAGGTSALITGSTTPFSNVWIEDLRGSNATYGNLYWTMQPSTLTSLAVPATLTASTVVFAATPVGTWANSAYYFCVTYVDALGGEGPCSLTYTQTPTLNYSATITSPAASTGAVGWRAYAGVGSLATAYLLPLNSTICTLTTLEQVMPACAIGSNAVILTAPTTTTSLKPNTQTSPTVNVNQTFPQGHTTFSYAPTAGTPVPFQQHYGPFTAYGALTSGQIAVLGSVNLPTGYLNVIGRTIRVTGKIALTTLNTATLPYITIGINWQAGLTAGAPVAVCSLVPAAAGATASASETFSCTMTVNAVGATAVGTIMTNGWELLAPAAGGALTGATTDTGTAAIGSLGLFAQNTLSVIYTSTTNNTGGEQLLDLHIETLQ